MRAWDDERAENGRVNVYKNDDGREYIGLYVPELLWKVSNAHEVQVRCDRGGSSHGSGASVENYDLKRSVTDGDG